MRLELPPLLWSCRNAELAESRALGGDKAAPAVRAPSLPGHSNSLVQNSMAENMLGSASNKSFCSQREIQDHWTDTVDDRNPDDAKPPGTMRV